MDKIKKKYRIKAGILEFHVEFRVKFRVEFRLKFPKIREFF